MMKTIAEYIILFFFYSAAGWLGESIYCSYAAGRWVNRGFLTGPITPIYGTGALVILILLTPLKANPILVFIVGIIACDIVEYFTSFIMEKLFNARWWDYSNKFLNLHGRICFQHSMIWGIAAILFLYVIHPKIGAVLLSYIPTGYIYTVLAVILIIFAFDLANAVRKAADFSKIMAAFQKLRDTFTAGEEALESGDASAEAAIKTNKLNEYTSQVKETYDSLNQLLQMRRDEKKRDKKIEKEEKEINRQKKRKLSQSKMLKKYPNLEKTVSKQLKRLEDIMSDIYRFTTNDDSESFHSDNDNEE